MSNIYASGTSGLRTAQMALDVIGHNIANANTPGYARQSVSVTSQMATQTAAGFMGGGVMPTGVNASVNQYLEAQLTQSTSTMAKSSLLSDLYQGLEMRISGTSNGIGDALASFTGALSQATNDPSSITARQLVLSSAKDLQQRITSTAEYLQTEVEQSSQALTSAASKSTDLLRQIADLNDKIAKVEPTRVPGTVVEGQMANDLRAQRQTLINELAQYMDVEKISSPEGDTIMSNGIALVVGNRSSTISTVADPLNPTRLNLVMNTSNGPVYLDAEGMGGKIGAYSEYLTYGVDSAKASLNHFSALMVNAFNEQQSKGVDLLGAAGASLFAPGAINSNVTQSPANTGSGAIALTVDLNNSQAAAYRVKFTNGNYQLINSTDSSLLGTVPAAGGSLSIDGLTLTFSGTPQEGDAWSVNPFGNAASEIKLLQTDPRRLALASPVAMEASVNNKGTATFSGLSVTSNLPLDPNLTGTVNITFTSATTYDISGPGIGTLTGLTYTPEEQISYNGWSMKLSGSPKEGDVFTIKAAQNNNGDGTNGNALMDTLTGKNFASGTMNLASLFSLMQSDIGARSGLIQDTAEVDAKMYEMAQNDRESYSGVNLDEEAADLAKWQQIYQANAKVMSVLQGLFQNLVNVF